MLKNDLRTVSRRKQAGLSLIDTVMSLGVMLVTSVGLMTATAVALTSTEGQGHLAARAAEYAQDKMEQLLSLAYGDGQTDTTQFPAASSGGTGLAVGGSSDPSNPVANYVDYLDQSGNPLTISGGTVPANWYYIRVWQVSTPAGTTNLKQVTVTSQVRYAAGSRGQPPKATVSSLKTNPF